MLDTSVTGITSLVKNENMSEAAVLVYCRDRYLIATNPEKIDIFGNSL